VRTAYKCLAYPDLEQASVLNRTFGCIRVVWNRTLVNAAKNILAAGLAVTACGADVRHSGSSRMQSAVNRNPSR
jgi:putative transposase